MTMILAIFAVYLVATVVLTVAARPYQKRIVVLAEQLRDQDMSQVERDLVESLICSSYSMRSAVVILFSYMSKLFLPGRLIDKAGEQFDELHPVLAKNGHVEELMEAHVVSAIAVNPIVGVLVLVARFAFALKARVHHDAKSARKLTDVVGLAIAG